MAQEAFECGDRLPGDIVYLKFQTLNTSDVPTTFMSGVVSVYRDDSATQSTAGVTLTSGFDSMTGHQLVVINTAADGTFYADGHDFFTVITAGTVNSVSWVGRVVGHFSIRNRMYRANVEQWLQVTAVADGDGLPVVDTSSIGGVSSVGDPGYVAIDWAHVLHPTTTLNLSATRISSVATADSVTVFTPIVSHSGTVVAATSTTITLAVDAVTTNNYYKDLFIGISTGPGAGQAVLIDSYVGSTRVATITGSWAINPTSSSTYVIFKFPLGAIWKQLTANMTLSGSIGKLFVDNLNAAVGSLSSSLTTILNRIGLFTGTGFNTIFGFLQSMARNDASTPSDMGGTYSASLHSEQAIANIAGGSGGDDASTIAAAVWDLDATAHQTQGTFGQVLGDSTSNTTSVWTGVVTQMGPTLNTVNTTVATTSTNVNTTNARIGAVSGSGSNTLLGILKALARKDAALTPTDIGGTYDNTTDSLQALEDNGLSVGGTVTVGGYSAGQDPATLVWNASIAEPADDTSARSNIGKMVRALYQRFFNRRTQTSTQQKIYKDNSSTIMSTMTVSDDGTTQTGGKSA